MEHSATLKSNSTRALLSVGFGLHLACFPLGSIGMTYFLQGDISRLEALVTNVIIFASSSVAMWACDRASSASGPCLRAQFVHCSYALSLIAVFAMAVVRMTLGENFFATLACATLFGVSLGVPHLFWHTLALGEWGERGRSAGIRLVATSWAVAALTIPLCFFVAHSRIGGSATIALILIASWVCATLALRDTTTLNPAMQRSCPTGTVKTAVSDMASKTQKPPHKGRHYETSRRIRLDALVFGVIWLFCFEIHIVGTDFLDAEIPLLAGSALCCLAVSGVFIAIFRSRHAASMTYGVGLRLVIVLFGSLLALMPLFIDNDVAILASCSILFQVQNVLNSSKNLRICHDLRLPVSLVFSSHYRIFSTGMCLGLAIVFPIVEAQGASESLPAMCSIGLVAVLALVPILPVKNSSASVMTHDILPEDETKEARLRKTCDEISDRYNLTPRERDILSLLLANRSREEMSETLNIGLSTVKNHTSALYRKVGVHSVRELIELVDPTKPDDHESGSVLR